MRILSLAIVALITAVPGTALAEEEDEEFVIPDDLCNKLAKDVAQPLAGEWEAVNRDGGGTVGSREIGLSGEDEEEIEFEYGGDGILVMLGINDQGPQRMELLPQEIAEHLPTDFHMKIDGKIKEVDVAEKLPCDWEDMPGFVGDITYDLYGMGTMNMKVITNFPSEYHGFGLLHFTGDMMGRRIDVLRYFSMTREE